MKLTRARVALTISYQDSESLGNPLLTWGPGLGLGSNQSLRVGGKEQNGVQCQKKVLSSPGSKMCLHLSRGQRSAQGLMGTSQASIGSSPPAVPQAHPHFSVVLCPLSAAALLSALTVSLSASPGACACSECWLTDQCTRSWHSQDPSMTQDG